MMATRRRGDGQTQCQRAVAAAVIVFATTAPGGTSAQAGEVIRSPLPLDVAVSLHRHNSRSPVNLSRDGAWIAHTVLTPETVLRGRSSRYSDTGFPFSEGNARMQATLSSSTGVDEVVLGDARATSWAPVWSPDGTRVAFYSDEGGEAGLWVWERETGERRRVSAGIVRPIFGLETPRWTPNSEQVLVKLLPAGRSLAEANAFAPSPTAAPEPSAPQPGVPTVRVRRSSTAEEGRGAADSDESEPTDDPVNRRMRTWAADLSLVDVRTGSIRRIASDMQIRSYDVSPDGQRIAYTVWKGYDQLAQENLFDLRLIDLDTGEDVVLGEGLALGSIGFGHEWSWSPDGRQVAWAVGGDITTISIPSARVRTLGSDVPDLRPNPPIWTAAGEKILAVAGGALWSLDPRTGNGEEIASIEGWSVRDLITPSYLTPVAWTSRGMLWVTASERDGRRSGIYAVDPSSGAAHPRLQETRTYGGTYGLAASDATGEVVFVAFSQRELEDLWLLDTEDGEVRRGSRINKALLGYELGTARLIRWRGTGGQELSGSLLLPPGYEESPRRLPLVIWVYGGSRGSRALDRFGLTGATPAHNLHILATRGYAILYPDVPLRTGRTIEDLVATVLPGVNAAIEAGYAHPDHLALMGQSYGAANVIALLTRTDRFGAALVSAAVQHPDLFAQYLKNPGYFESGQGNMGGTIWEHPDRYRANSPLFDFPRIETPLLMAQGEEDGDLVASEAIFSALDRLGKHVEYRVYPGEDHVISSPANVIDLWERRLEFLARHLDLSLGPDGRVEIR